MASGTDFRNSLRRLAHRVRAVPGKLGWRPYTLQVQQRSYAGSERGEGAQTVQLLSITEADSQSPKVRFLNNEEIALGNYANEAVEVGPITPDFGTGGTSVEMLLPSSLGDNTVLHYILTGPKYPNGAQFRFVSLQTDHAGHYLLRLDRAADE